MISKLLQILSLQPRISKVFLDYYFEQFFLKVGQNNFGYKILYHRQNLANRSIGPSPWIKFVLEKHEWPANTANSKNFELVFFILVWAGKTWLWGVSFGGHKIAWINDSDQKGTTLAIKNRWQDGNDILQRIYLYIIKLNSN